MGIASVVTPIRDRRRVPPELQTPRGGSGLGPTVPTSPPRCESSILGIPDRSPLQSPARPAPNQLMAADRASMNERAQGVLAAIEDYRDKVRASSEVEGLYLGPPWELPVRPVTESGRGWKIATLQRIAGRGAEHWGHIYVVVVLRRAAWDVETATNPGEMRPLLETEEVKPVPFDDPGLLLFIRPRLPAYEIRLRTLALDLARSLPSSEERPKR